MTGILEELFGADGKHVVVTGGSRGIGRMIAAGFVGAGATVYISARKAEACDATAAELDADGPGTCISLPADLSSEDGARSLVDAVAQHTDRLHVLVNNAGATWGAPLDEYPDAAFDKLFDINVKGPFHLTRSFLPMLRATASAEAPARVINIGSIDGIRVPAMNTYGYSATKAGIHMLTRHLAHELHRDHITVNAVAPGPFMSKMMAFALEDDASHGAAIESTVPLGRIGRDGDMAAVCLFLAGHGGSYLTGAVIPVDGGISTHG